MPSVYQAVRSTIVFSFLIRGAQCAVRNVFNVKAGKTNGGCDGYPDLDQWFSDAQTLANVAATATAATDTDSRKYLKTFFSIGPRDNANQVAGPVQQVIDILSGSILPPGGKPWLFCSSEWLKEQKWTDVAYDQTTGKPRTDGQSVKAIYGETPKQAPFWSDDLKEYIISDPGDYCATPTYLGATQDMSRPSTVTLCVKNFSPTQKSTLAKLPAVTAEKTSISTLQVHSITLFHEMFHLALGTVNTPDAGYALNSVVRYGTPKAIKNPESYAFYALACYLGQRNPGYTFANSKSVKKPTVPMPIESMIDVEVENEKLLRFQQDKKDLSYNEWVA